MTSSTLLNSSSLKDLLLGVNDVRKVYTALCSLTEYSSTTVYLLFLLDLFI